MVEYNSRSTRQNTPRPDYGDHHRRNKNDFGGTERFIREEAAERNETTKNFQPRQDRPKRPLQSRRNSTEDHHKQAPRSYREYHPVRKTNRDNEQEESPKRYAKYPDVKQHETRRPQSSGRRYISESNQPSENDVKMENARKFERSQKYHKEHYDKVVEKRFANREFTEKLQEEGKLPRKFEYSHKMNPSLDRRMHSFEHRQRKERQPKPGHGRYRMADEKTETIKTPEFTQKMVSLTLNESVETPNENKKANFTKMKNEHKEKVETSTKPANYRSLEEYLAE